MKLIKFALVFNFGEEFYFKQQDNIGMIYFQTLAIKQFFNVFN